MRTSSPHIRTIDHRTLVDLVESRVAAGADKALYTFLRNGDEVERVLSSAELHRRACAIALRLHEYTEIGDRALILIPPGSDYYLFVAALLACMRAGVIAVPVPPPARRRGLPRLCAIAADCQPRLALTTSALAAAIQDSAQPELTAPLASLKWLALDTIDDDACKDWRAPNLSHNDCALLQYTSGSTDTPKGVVVSHDNLVDNLRQIQRAFGQSDESVIVSWLPPYHDMGLIGTILQPLYVDARSIHMAPQDFLVAPIRWLAAISRYRATTSGGPNFAYDLCCAKISEEERASLDLSCWKVAFNGAEPVRAATLQRFAAYFGAAKFKRSAFYPCYGLAEATLFVSGGGKLADTCDVLEVKRDKLEKGEVEVTNSPNDSAMHVVSCGRSDAQSEVKIVDPFARVPVGEHSVGEVWLRSRSVALGYWCQSERTAETFAATMADGTGPYLRTGDLGFIAGGNLYLTGRHKDLIVVRGRNIYPQDLEQTAERSHAQLRIGGGAAFAIESNGEERVVLVQEIGGASEVDYAKLEMAVRQAIADRHDVNLHALILIRAGTLPRTTSGKVQRRLCCVNLQSGSLASVWRSDEYKPAVQAVLAPLTATQAKVLAIWCDVLQSQEIDVTRGFLAQGGDSLRAVQVSARLAEVLSVDVKPSDLLDNLSISELAQRIDSGALMATSAGPKPRGSQFANRTIFALSPVQERMWFLERLAAGVPVNHIAVFLRFGSELQRSALEWSIHRVVARHEALRTRFLYENGRPVQEIMADTAVDLAWHHLPENAEATQSFVREQARLPFDLASRPPVRWTLAQIGSSAHLLVLTCHHLVADGWSINCLLQELSQLYQAQVQGKNVELAPATLHYVDYELWRRSCEEAHLDAPQLAYWQERLRGEMAPLDLDFGRARPSVQTYRGAREVFHLPPTCVAGLHALAAAANVTLFGALASGLFALFARYTGQTDLCLGVPVAGRNRVELERVVGCFVNTVAVRVDLADNPTIECVLSRVGQAIAQAQTHQDVPFERVLQACATKRDNSRSPIFQAMLSLQPPLSADCLLAFGSETTIEQVDTGSAQVDLALDLSPDRGGLRAAWEYNTDLYEASAIQQLSLHFIEILGEAIKQPKLRVSELAISTAPPLTAAPLATAAADEVHRLFEGFAVRQPHAVAVIAGATQLCYAELNTQANRLAHFLRDRGVGVESRVAIYLERSAESVVAALALFKAGAAYVALDPSHPVERTALVLADAAIQWIVTSRSLVSTLVDAKAPLICLDQLGSTLAGLASDNLAMPANDRLAYLVYTSGSTGRPKGVAVGQRALASIADAWPRVYPFAPQELRLLSLASPAFDVWTADWVRALTSGGTLVIGSAQAALDPAALIATIASHRITALDIVPAMVTRLLTIWQQHQATMASLRLLIVGSDVWTWHEHAALCRVCAPHTRILSCYGLSETAIDSTWFEKVAPIPAEPQQAVPLGRAFANTRVHIVDRHGQRVPLGVPGELAIAGTGLARGYWQQPGLTAARFVPNPFAEQPGDRLFRTGDRVRQRGDGTIEFLGRVDHQLKIRGMRIEPGEIEACLSRHPAVAKAVVVAKKSGSTIELLAAYVASDGVVTPNEASLKDFVREHLPPAMVPTRIVALDRLPLNANGKVDRMAIVTAVAVKDWPQGLVSLPRTPLECTVAAIWQEALPQAVIGVNDNFFDLGGHSLLLAAIAQRLRDELAQPVAIVDLLRYPTVASLAAALQPGAGTSAGATSMPNLAQALAGQRRRAAAFVRRKGGQENPQ